MEIRATGALRGSIKRVEQVLRVRDSGAVLGSDTALGPFLDGGKVPVDPLKSYGLQSFSYNSSLGFDGRPADLVTTVMVEDAVGGPWLLEHVMRWERLDPPTPKSPANITVRQNDAASGCSFHPVHGYGLALDLSWEPPPAAVPGASYSVSVFDGRGRDLINATYNLTDTQFRFVRCGAHVESGAERHARFGVRTYHAPSQGLSAFAVAEFDFQSCRESGVPACQ